MYVAETGRGVGWYERSNPKRLIDLKFLRATQSTN